MKALTLYQPYATAMALGVKRIETRSRPISYRGTVVIHSALMRTREMERGFASWLHDHPDDRAAFSAAGYRFFAELPFGQTLAVADLVDVVPVETFIDGGHRTPGGELITLTPTEVNWGDYTPGRFAWIFANLRRLDRPRHVSGAQGLWEYKHGAIEVPAPAAAHS